MGCGASHAEITEGSAVTGRWDQKLVMPPGVAAEAIAGGMKPGKALKNFTPTRVQALLIKRSARKLYDEFESEIAADCGDTYHYQPMRKQGAIILGTGGDNSVLSMPSCPSQLALLDSPCTAAVSLTRAMSERRAGQFLRGFHGQRLRL